jgi:hypothetical protein
VDTHRIAHFREAIRQGADGRNLSRLDAQGEPTLAVDPASFNGIEPGRTTANEMRAAMEPKYGLGEAFTREDESAGFAWELDEGPFERAEATVSPPGGTVRKVRTALAMDTPPT